jgi:hypothetical protein
MKKTAFFIFLLSQTLLITAQVGIGTSSPNANAALDITSSSKGLLIPRLTSSQRNSINAPSEGLLIYNTTASSLEVYTKGLKSPRIHLNYSTGNNITSGDNAWQEFTPTTSGYITKITLKHENPRNPPTAGSYEFEMHVLEGVTGYNLSALTGGKTIGYSSIVIPAGQNSTDYSVAEYDYIFSPGVFVEAGTKYWFQINDLTNSATYGSTYLHSSDVYPGHLAYVGGIGNDIYFKITLQPLGPLFWKSLQ